MNRGGSSSTRGEKSNMAQITLSQLSRRSQHVFRSPGERTSQLTRRSHDISPSSEEGIDTNFVAIESGEEAQPRCGTPPVSPSSPVLISPPDTARSCSTRSVGSVLSMATPRRSTVAPEARLRQQGRLTVHVKSAKNLVSKGSDGLSDPFAVVSGVGSTKKRYRTVSKWRTRDPKWDQLFDFQGSLHELVDRELLITVYNFGMVSKNEYVGEASFDLSGLAHEVKLSFRDVPLRNAEHGTLSVSVKFEQEPITFAFPGPVAESAAIAILEGSTPPDASCFEAARDRLLRLILRHGICFMYLTAFWVLAFVVWVGILVALFPLNLGLVPWTVYGLSEQRTKSYWVFVNGVVCALFTWQHGLSLPWRLAAALHLCTCRGRDSSVGLDFYGRPTEAMFFHIPRRERVQILMLLNLAVLLQFAQQAARIYYSTFEESESPPGNIVIMCTFLPSVVFGIGGGLWQFRSLYKLFVAFPERFPPSAGVVALSGLQNRWRTGDRNLCSLCYGSMVEFKEAAEIGAYGRQQSIIQHQTGVHPTMLPIVVHCAQPSASSGLTVVLPTNGSVPTAAGLPTPELQTPLERFDEV